MRTRYSRGIFTPAGVTFLATVLITGLSCSAFAQTPYVPYFGKNKIRYDDFKWRIYTTDHFEIY